MIRATAAGKFLWAGEEKFHPRGATYGPFHPDAQGLAYPAPAIVECDFARIAASGLNAVRTYDVPPRWLLDLAERHGLRVMVGLQVEQRAGFLNDRRVLRETRELVRAKVRACGGHPALLCTAIANEIPASIVRWHGPRRVESFLHDLYEIAKDADPEGLFCYANYPTTEYLDLSFLDLECFNVFLESQRSFEAYLARLANVAGNRPLLMTEIGLDSKGRGERAQAATVDWQIRAAAAAGCAGVFVFSWTDDWYSRGEDVQDWAFGLTDRMRRPKSALAAVRKAYAEFPFPPGRHGPRISVVVCSYNGARTLRSCLEGLGRLRYPNYETIVVDDGSTDETAAVASEFPVRVISTKNSGLSAARNTGFQAADGEIVAYIDDDTCPDPDWLSYLALGFEKGDFAAVGGPNIPFPDDGPTAHCIANAPGGPKHVLLTDTEADHIPGCNMAIRKSWLEAIGGFDPQFRVAGDDVDVCWRLRQSGGKLGFSPGAMVWHHARGSIRTFWKQQKGYGKAEALLERKWPEKYNSAGHLTGGGRIYGHGLLHVLERSGSRIYQGTWGSAAYGRLYGAPASPLLLLALMPEWYLLSLALAVLCGIGYLWNPLWIISIPSLAVVAGTPCIPILKTAWRTHLKGCSPGRLTSLRFRLLTVFLHLLQPLGRLRGRLSLGLAPWRRRGAKPFVAPRCRTFWAQCNRWKDSWERLAILESHLRVRGAVVRRGNDYDSWDLAVAGGPLGAARLLMADEADGHGNQLVRVRVWPQFSLPGLVALALFAGLALAAAFDRAPIAAAFLGWVALGLAGFLLRDCASAAALVRGALRDLEFEE